MISGGSRQASAASAPASAPAATASAPAGAAADLAAAHEKSKDELASRLSQAKK